MKLNNKCFLYIGLLSLLLTSSCKKVAKEASEEIMEKGAKSLSKEFTEESLENISTCTVEHPLSACHPIAYFPLSNPSFHFSVDYCCSNNSKCSASLS